MQCLLDVDGVLTDFVGGLLAVHGIKDDPYHRPENLGLWNTNEALGMSAEECWGPLNCFEFWANLDFKEDAHMILEIVESKFGRENIALLTSPALFNHECSSGKHYWIDKHLPRYRGRWFIGEGKAFLAAPDRVLIDDRDKNYDEYIQKGPAILLPRPWNRLHKLDSIPYLEKELSKL